MSKPIPLALVAGLLPFCPALAAQSGAAEPQRRSVIRPSLPYEHDAATQHPDQVVLKFRERIRVRLVDGALRSPDGVDLTAVTGRLGDAVVSRLFTRPVEELDAERVRLQADVPDHEEPLADLNNYFLLRTSGVAETERLVNELNELEGVVETAYAEWIPVLFNDIPPPTPSWEGRQDYLRAAPAGFAWRAIKSVVGARFQGRRLAHLEGAWEVGHEDASFLQTPLYLGAPPSGTWNTSSWRNHGTACVGVMGADLNEYGVTGMGSGARRFFLVSLSNGQANSINLATGRMQPGDVMSSSWGLALGQNADAPLDFPQANFDAVRRAAAAGLLYAFSSGNSGQNLANTTIFGTRYLPTSPSSNGFIIGATSGGATSRAGFSNYGARVDANGWGSLVYTMGYGDLFNGGGDVRQLYTRQFSGTSSAAPCVAGVIAAYVGVVAEQNGTLLSVAQVRNDLQTTGTAVSGQIGNRPELRQLLALHNLPDGLLVTTYGSVGGTWTFEVSGFAGEIYQVFFSLFRNRVPLGFNRDVLIDLATVVPFPSANIPNSGVHTVTIPVPNIPQLQGLRAYLQAAIARSGSVHLTNSAELFIK